MEEVGSEPASAKLAKAFVCQCADGYIGLRCETHESGQGEYNQTFANRRELCGVGEVTVEGEEEGGRLDLYWVT